jgi:dipeptidase E
VSNELLLLSTSRLFGGEYLDYAREVVAEFFRGVRRVYFAPFAVDAHEHDSYTQQTAEGLAPLGLEVVGLHKHPEAVSTAEAIFVGGGNSFRLLKALQQHQMVEVVKQRVERGELRYMGSSAGSNIACPTLRTTNDMPIVQPASFAAFDLVPFQINPHYLDADPSSTHMGETRARRLEEFLQENDVPVVGLREGAWLRRRGAHLELGGLPAAGGVVFLRGREPQEVASGSDVSWLLRYDARFDCR